MTVTWDAAELAKAIRDEVVSWPRVDSGSRQVGSPKVSAVDIVTVDGQRFVITIADVTEALTQDDPDWEVSNAGFRGYVGCLAGDCPCPYRCSEAGHCTAPAALSGSL